MLFRVAADLTDFVSFSGFRILSISVIKSGTRTGLDKKKVVLQIPILYVLVIVALILINMLEELDQQNPVPIPSYMSSTLQTGIF
jgi:hypothetical protein